MECIFCNIINHKIPSYTIFEDDIVEVFLDIHPDVNGHLLIIPKKHILDISEMDIDTWKHILEIVKKMRVLLENTLGIDGLTLVQNNGMVQEVKHFHLHLKPYYEHTQLIIPIEELYNKLNQEK